MKWEEIRKAFPDQWLIIEAIEAHTEDNKRILDRISVVEAFPDAPDSSEMYQCYLQLHKQMPHRELLWYHTTRETIDIIVENFPTWWGRAS